MNENLVKVAPLSDFDEVGCKTVQVNGHVVALFKYGDTFYAVDNRCPHMGFPLDTGTVKDGILVCHWHHARFDLASGGTFDLWADDVRSFSVTVQEDHLWVDTTPPTGILEQQTRRLYVGLERDIPLVLGKAVMILLDGTGDAVEPFRVGVDFGTRFRQNGWGQGLTMNTCFMNMLPHLHEEDRARALYQGLSAVARDSANQPARFTVDPLPNGETDLSTLKRWFRSFVEVRDPVGSERCVVSAIRAGADDKQMADMLFAAATDHRYIDIGHPLDFTNKAFETLDIVGWEMAEQVLTSLVRGYAMAARMEESNAWRSPIDLIELLTAAFEKLPAALEAGNGKNGTLPENLIQTLLADDPAATIDQLLDILESGVAPTALAQAVAYAAALRIARFHTSNEFPDWDTALHTFTFANAVHEGLQRTHSAESTLGLDLIRGIFDAAMSIYLDRFLNIPAAKLPSANGHPPNLQADLSARMNQQQQVNQSAKIIADALGHGVDSAEILATLGKMLLREDRDFHTIQSVEAAMRLYSYLEGTPEGGHVLIACTRYLAAHAPTVRAQGQTYAIARRLHKGDNLFEE